MTPADIVNIPGATLVTVLRHGAVSGPAGVYRGGSEAAMTQAAARRLRQVVDRLGRPPYDRVASSPYPRCLTFARAYAGACKLRLEIIEDFREMAFGAWEGKTPAEAAHEDPDLHRAFRASAGAVPPPGGESVLQLRERVAQAWDHWLRDADGGHRLLLTHAGVMRALCMHWLDISPAHAWRIALPEGAHVQVSVLAGQPPMLLTLNAVDDAQ